MADCQAPPPGHGTGDAALQYLSRYVVGTAIQDGRILADDGQYVTIRIKDYRHDREDVLSLSGEEFVRRFALHILPRGLHRARYAGLFRPRGRKERLATCLRALEARGAPVAAVPGLVPLRPPPQPEQEQHEQRRQAPNCPPPSASAAGVPAESDAWLSPSEPPPAIPPESPGQPPATPLAKERPPRHCPRCGMPGMTWTRYLRVGDVRRFVWRLNHFLRRMITIITTTDLDRLSAVRLEPLPLLDEHLLCWSIDIHQSPGMSASEYTRATVLSVGLLPGISRGPPEA